METTDPRGKGLRLEPGRHHVSHEIHLDGQAGSHYHQKPLQTHTSPDVAKGPSPQSLLRRSIVHGPKPTRVSYFYVKKKSLQDKKKMSDVELCVRLTRALSTSKLFLCQALGQSLSLLGEPKAVLPTARAHGSRAGGQAKMHLLRPRGKCFFSNKTKQAQF